MTQKRTKDSSDGEWEAVATSRDYGFPRKLIFGIFTDPKKAIKFFSPERAARSSSSARPSIFCRESWARRVVAVPTRTDVPSADDDPLNRPNELTGARGAPWPLRTVVVCEAPRATGGAFSQSLRAADGAAETSSGHSPSRIGAAARGREAPPRPYSESPSCARSGARGRRPRTVASLIREARRRWHDRGERLGAGRSTDAET